MIRGHAAPEYYLPGQNILRDTIWVDETYIDVTNLFRGNR